MHKRLPADLTPTLGSEAAYESTSVEDRQNHPSDARQNRGPTAVGVGAKVTSPRVGVAVRAMC
jgi:hypothetical protein